MSDVVWKNSAAFWLLWSLPVLVALAIFAHRRVRRAARQFAGRVMTPRLLPPLDWRGPLRKSMLFVAGIALAIVAAARPSWGVYYLKTGARGLDLVVVLDVSRSMLADDSGDTRLGRAKTAISWLVRELGGDRVGLLMFAGQTSQACPLTLDRGFFESSLRAADPTAVGRGGTKIGPALDEALRMLDTSWDRDKLVLLVTDGGDQESFPKTAAEKLRDKKIRVISLGLGRADEGAPLVLDGQVVRRKDGQPVSARLNDTLLKDLAIETQGMYVPPEEAHRLAELYRANFGGLRRGQNQELQEKHYFEQYQWFLLGAIVLLLWQAGRSAYTGKRALAGGTGSMAALVLAGLTLGVLSGCSGEATRLDQGIALLEQGDANAAEDVFLELATERTDEPVLDYDLAVAHQARNRLREARSRYVDVLENGDKKLRARARTNLAMLALEQLREQGGAEPGAVEGEARERLRELAEAALDDFQTARNLDPGLTEAVRRQDLLARWLRAVENEWRERDRQAEREARAAQQGAAFLAAIAEAQDTLRTDLASGELLEDLELRQRDLAEDLGGVRDHFADQGAELAEEFRDEVGAGVDAIAPAMEEIAGLLRDAQNEAAFAAMQRVSARLWTLWMLWSEPGAALARASREQAGFVRAVQQQIAARVAMKRLDQARLEQQTLLADRAQQELTELETTVQKWVANLRRRFEPAQVAADWSALFVERANRRLPEVDASIQRAIDRIGATGPQSMIAADRAARALEGLAFEWEIAGLDGAALARRLEQQQVELVRAAEMLRTGIEDDQADGLLARLGQVARQFVTSQQWPSLRAAQQDQADRVEYLPSAIERALAEELPEDADEATRQQVETRRAVLEGMTEQARGALARAVEAMQGSVDPAAIDAMHAARVALRSLWGALTGEFPRLLQAAAKEQGALATQGEAASESDAKDAADRAVAELAFQGAVARREQAVTAQLIDALLQGWSAEVQRVEAELAAAESPPAEPDPNAPAPAAVDLEELEARLAAMRSLDELLRPAAEAAGTAAEVLTAEPPDDMPAFERLRARFREAAPHQRRAADLLAEALQQLEQASLPLKELAKRIMDGESKLLRATRELAAGRVVTADDGSDVTWQQLLEAQRPAAAYVERLAPAFDRELEQMRQAQQAQPNGAGAPDDTSEAEQAMRGLIASVESAFAESLRAFESDEKPRAAEAVAATLDASRRIWSGSAEFKELLELAVEEQAELLARSEQLAEPDVAESMPDRVRSASEDQIRTAELVPPLRARLDTIKQQAQQAQAAPAPTGDPTGAPQPPPAAPGGLSPEVIELAERNLPEAAQAMSEGKALVDSSSWNDAMDRQERAHRLLKEILDKLEDEEQQQQQDQQQQPQPSPQQLSPEEMQRLVEAVQERNDRQRDSAKRTPVEEDW